jgi:hypothetical protein
MLNMVLDSKHVLWALWQGSCEDPALKGKTPVQVALAIFETRHRPLINPLCPVGVTRLINQCWHEDPARRPTFAQLCTELLTCQERLNKEASEGQGQGQGQEHGDHRGIRHRGTLWNNNTYDGDRDSQMFRLATSVREDEGEEEGEDSGPNPALLMPVEEQVARKHATPLHRQASNKQCTL